MDTEKIALIAQEISFAYEDHYSDRKKQQLFHALFDRYLAPIDSDGSMDPYDAIVLLGRKNPDEFQLMVQEMKDAGLIKK